MKNSHLKSRRPSLRTQLLTLYTNGRLPTLGTIRSINQEYVWKPNEWGQAAETVLKTMQQTSKIIMIQEFVVMPNHIHFLLSYRQHKPYILNWFARRCKRMMTPPMLHAKHTSLPIWEGSFHSTEIRHEYTLHAVCENLREHHRLWQYDMLCREAHAALLKEKKEQAKSNRE